MRATKIFRSTYATCFRISWRSRFPNSSISSSIQFFPIYFDFSKISIYGCEKQVLSYDTLHFKILIFLKGKKKKKRFLSRFTYTYIRIYFEIYLKRIKKKKKRSKKKKRQIVFLRPSFSRKQVYRPESRKIESSDENATLEVYEARYSRDDSKESFVESGMVEWRER